MRTLFALIVVAILGILAWPWLGPMVDNALFAIRLSTSPAPTSVAVPVAGVSRRSLVDTWGAARSEGRRHEGIDIFARRGTEVVAATEGLVARVGENRLGGLSVWVLGPGRQRHYYAHLDRYADTLSPGDRVAVGDVLGYVGNTGNARATPPHLHYGIYTIAGAINPYPLLKAPPDPMPAPAAGPAATLPTSASGR
jgi:murein DD-endopeptidase MepM/ murein hydrolase activator NlpD